MPRPPRLRPPALLAALGLWAAACSNLTGAAGYGSTDCTSPRDCQAGSYCVPVAGGGRCSACQKAEYECGATTCCDQGQTCTDRDRGVCVTPWGKVGQSCEGLGLCNGESCCTSIAVPGGTFTMGSKDLSLATPHQATVSDFTLDKYEVTVGRFRKFAENWDYVAPKAGVGAHPKIPNTGWRTEWAGRLPLSQEDVLANLTDSDTQPVIDVNWYEAFVFCAWDGGRLPTEAEWEYAAANGAKDTKYPWGASDPTPDLAVYDCGSDTPPCAMAPTATLPVGSKPSGRNDLGHLDLAGNVGEWVFDGYADYGTIQSNNYASSVLTDVRVVRGGSFGSNADYLRAAYRIDFSPSDYVYNFGLRCSRTP